MFVLFVCLFVLHSFLHSQLFFNFFIKLLRTSLVHNKQLSVICQEMDFQNYLITSDTEVSESVVLLYLCMTVGVVTQKSADIRTYVAVLHSYFFIICRIIDCD